MAVPLVEEEASLKSSLPDNEDVYPLLQYSPEIDGLRAVAVVPVVLFHFDFGFSGGFTGVDVFFVISGYLISAIMFGELGRGRFLLSKFYLRRARRLFPALAAMVAVTVVASNFVLLRQAYIQFAKSVWMVLLGVGNFRFYMDNTGYTATLAEEIPLLHCWSLAVEEQFYFVAPFVLWAVWRKCKKLMSVITIMVILGSLPVAIFATKDDPNFTFYLLPARAWEMALGVLLAILRGKNLVSKFSRRAFPEILGIAGISLIITSYFIMDRQTPYPSYNVLLPCCGTALFLLSTQHVTRGKVHYCLSLTPIVFIGKISYSLYLWHWPIHMFQQYTAATAISLGTKLWGITLSFVLATVSYVSLERTFRAPTKVGNRKFLLFVFFAWTTLVAATVVIASQKIGGIYGVSKPLGLRPSLFQNENTSEKCLIFWNASQLDIIYDVKPSDITLSNILGSRSWEANRFNFGDNGDQPYFAGPSFEETSFPSIVVIGNSHAEMYGPLLERLADEYGIRVAFLVKDGDFMGRFFDPLNSWDQTRLEFLTKWRPQKIVWFDFFGQETYPFSNYDFNHALSLLLSVSNETVVFGDVPTLPIVQRVSNDWLRRYIYFRWDDATFLTTLQEDFQYESRRLQVESLLERTISDLGLENEPRARFVELASYFKGANNVLQLIDPYEGTLVYKDFHHLNIDGILRVEQSFRKELFGEEVCSDSIFV